MRNNSATHPKTKCWKQHQSVGPKPGRHGCSQMHKYHWQMTQVKGNKCAMEQVVLARLALAVSSHSEWDTGTSMPTDVKWHQATTADWAVLPQMSRACKQNQLNGSTKSKETKGGQIFCKTSDLILIKEGSCFRIGDGPTTALGCHCFLFFCKVLLGTQPSAHLFNVV